MESALAWAISIQSFRCRDTEAIYQCARVARWVNIERASTAFE